MSYRRILAQIKASLNRFCFRQSVLLKQNIIIRQLRIARKPISDRCTKGISKTRRPRNQIELHASTVIPWCSPDVQVIHGKTCQI